MSENESETQNPETAQPAPEESHEPGDIADAQLPEDLQPTEDNPLARHPGQTGEESDQIGAETGSEPETAPMDEEDADYGDTSG